MENQTRYDLNAALESWRQALAAQPALTADIRRELETHLRDAITGFQQRGLGDEESFWLACRRVGQPPRLAEEFIKADPAAVWRERVLWMAVSLVGSYVFMTWKDLLASWLNPKNYIWIEWLYLVPLLLLIAAVVMIRRGRLPNPIRIGKIPSWTLACGLFLLMTATVVSAYIRSRNLPGDGLLGLGYNIGMMMSWFGNAVWPLVMVLILVLTLKQNRKSPKHA